MLKSDLGSPIPNISFSKKQKKRMIEAAKIQPVRGSKKALFSKLEQIAHEYLRNKVLDNSMPPYRLEQIFRKLHGLAKKINESMHINNNEIPLEIMAYLRRHIHIHINMHTNQEGIDYGQRIKIAENKTNEVLEYLNLFEKVTLSATKLIKGRIETSKSTRKGDDSLIDLFYELSQLWTVYFERAPGTSVSQQGKVGGPFVRFIKEYFNTILSCLPTEFRESQTNLVKQLSMSEAAVRNRIMKLSFPKGKLTITHIPESLFKKK